MNVSVFRYGLIALCNLVMLSLAAGVITVILLLPGLPDIETIKTLQLKVPLRVYTNDGMLIGEFGDQRRIPIKIEQTPAKLIAAVLTAEDDRYYQHVGIDYRGVLRAMYSNFVSGSRAQGASTITMQVARNFYLTKERTYLRKAKEALLALRLEQYFSKDEILELYLNKIFLGHRSYGFGAAANVYYGKPLEDLNVPQFAMLAALPKAPSSVNPISNPDNAKVRRDYILRRMKDLGFISEQEYFDYIAHPLSAELHVSEVQLKAPYVAEHIRIAMVNRFGTAAYEDGYSVYSTVISKNQIAAVSSLREGLIRYDRRHGYRGAVQNWDIDNLNAEQQLDALQQLEPSQEIVPVLIVDIQPDKAVATTRNGEQIAVAWEHMKWARRYQTVRSRGPSPKHPADVLNLGDIVYARPAKDGVWELVQIPTVNGALVSIDPVNGAVLAMAGGFDYYLDQFNRVTQGVRLMGSNIKPFVYSAALNHGFTPGSLVSGLPIVVEDQQSEILWRPRNYSGEFTGDTRLRIALAKSLNLVSVRLIRGIGTDTVIDHIAKFGFEKSQLPVGWSVALGSAGATPLTVVSGYAVFANGGYLVEPYFIDVVKDRHGRVVFRGERTRVCQHCLFQTYPVVADSEDIAQPPWNLAERVISSANAFVMTEMLRGVIRGGTGRKAKSLNRSDLGGKTGTTNDFEDAWFSGFNANVATTVWVGFDDPSDLGRNEHGAGLALPVWIDYMKVALENTPEKPLQMPNDVVSVMVDAKTGEAVPEGTKNAVNEYYFAGTQPVVSTASMTSPSEDGSDFKPDEQPASDLF